jgi:hypothetical protein
MAGDEYFKHMIGRVIYRTAITDFIITLILRPVLEMGSRGGRDGGERVDTCSLTRLCLHSTTDTPQYDYSAALA